MKKTKKKVLFISYEYTFGTFSGNGVLAASTVRGFLNDDSDFDDFDDDAMTTEILVCLLYTSPSPRDQRGSRMPSSA